MNNKNRVGFKLSYNYVNTTDMFLELIFNTFYKHNPHKRTKNLLTREFTNHFMAEGMTWSFSFLSILRGGVPDCESTKTFIFAYFSIDVL